MMQLLHIALLIGMFQPLDSQKRRVEIVNASPSVTDFWVGDVHAGRLQPAQRCEVRLHIPASAAIAVGAVAANVADGLIWNAGVVPSNFESLTLIWGDIHKEDAAETQAVKGAVAVSERFWSSRLEAMAGHQKWRPLAWKQTGFATVFEDRTVRGGVLSIRTEVHDYLVNSIGTLFTRIPAGTFTIAQRGGPEGRQATLSSDFYMAVAETTQAQLDLLHGRDPGATVDPDLPAVNMTWKQAVDACSQLRDVPQWHYVLPTEAQWEYACQGGALAPFNPAKVGLGKIMWYNENSGFVRHPVAQLRPNTFGLFDMHGNVREWCHDRWSPIPPAGVDPTGPASGNQRVRRGGAFDVPQQWCSCGARDAGQADIAQPWLGYRMVLQPALHK